MDQFFIVQAISFLTGIILLLLGGAYLLDPSIYKKHLTWSLGLSGIKPKINQKMMKYGKIQAMFMIVAGLTFVYLGIIFKNLLGL